MVYIHAPLLALLLSFLQLHTSTARCETSRDFRTARQTIVSETESAIGRNPSLIAAFVRAAFHDCAPAHARKPGTGCNGSLRAVTELSHPDNRRLGAALHIAETMQTRVCLSLADVLLLAMATSVRTAGGADFVASVITVDTQHEDVPTGVDDLVDGELGLPQKDSSFDDLLLFYSRRGFSLRDFVSSVASAHSLGHFPQTVRSHMRKACSNPPGDGLLPFTPDVFNVSTAFASNIYARKDGACNSPGFNTLASDERFLDSPAALRILKQYSGNLRRLNRDFKVFALKMARLSDRTVPAL